MINKKNPKMPKKLEQEYLMVMNYIKFLSIKYHIDLSKIKISCVNKEEELKYEK